MKKEPKNKANKKTPRKSMQTQKSPIKARPLQSTSNLNDKLFHELIQEEEEKLHQILAEEQENLFQILESEEKEMQEQFEAEELAMSDFFSSKDKK